jgi:hypothetical protein
MPGMRPGQGKGPYVGPSGIGGGTPAFPTAVPTWMRFTFTHLDLQAAALTNDFEIYSAPIRVNILGCILKHTIAFAGTAITQYHVTVGLAANLSRYLSSFDVTTAPSNTKPAGYAEGYFGDQLQFGAVTSIRVGGTSVGANLNQSTAGAGTLWLLISRIDAP